MLLLKIEIYATKYFSNENQNSIKFQLQVSESILKTPKVVVFKVIIYAS